MREEDIMLEDQRPGSVYWIDHYVVGTNDLDRWMDFHERILGARPYGQVDERRQIGAFQKLTHCHHGGFVQKNPLPATRGLGKECPRYGFFTRQEDIDGHLRRLDQHQVPHSDPIHTSAEGEDGTVIYWEDPDGNEFEFWAPVHLPPGAMDDCGPLKVGRISHGVYESRDLQRTADFYHRFCALDPNQSSDIPGNTLVLPLAGGARDVYRQAEELGRRVGGRGEWRGLHAALVVRDEDYLPSYRRMWGELSEWEFDREKGLLPEAPERLPARTALHGSAAGRKFKEVYGRGDDFYDWDMNSFHFVGGVPERSSMAVYEARTMEFHMQQLLESQGQGGALPREMPA
ncbi:MAG: hypothetical protein GEU73_02130 [Chloroflexi bacterium]|nr:hypothetical protein [Chloroflexota bacterium]